MKRLAVFFTLSMLYSYNWAAIGGGYNSIDEKSYFLRMSDNEWGDFGQNELANMLEKLGKRPRQFERQSLYNIEVYKKYKTKGGLKTASKPFKKFKDLLCGYELSKPTDIRSHFVCEKKAGFPLSGAKFLITPPVTTQGLTDEQEYERCKLFLKEDQESLTCIANCKSSTFTPRKMSAGGFECE